MFPCGLIQAAYFWQESLKEKEHRNQPKGDLPGMRLHQFLLICINKHLIGGEIYLYTRIQTNKYRKSCGKRKSQF